VSEPPTPAAERQGPLLIGLTCLGSLTLLLLARAALQQRALLTPNTPRSQLVWIRHAAVDPEQRREASLLLASGEGENRKRRKVLEGQGWGRGPLAPVVLKLDALAAEQGGGQAAGDALWRALLHRFPGDPASADALYALGRQDPSLRQELLRRFPSHPAALAAALETGPTAEAQRQGALHLARWGARWPGADALLHQVCQQQNQNLPKGDRRQLALGLAELGDGTGALSCLAGARGGSSPSKVRLDELGFDASGALRLGQSLLKGPPEQQRAGERLLLSLTGRWPLSPEALESARLLSQVEGPGGLALIGALPPPLGQSAPVQARLAREGKQPWQPVLKRWPRDPASWDLQWELARERLLKGQWSAAATLLTSIESDELSAPLAARQQFWLGYAQQQLGGEGAAKRTWERLLQFAPTGYYGWRASLQLGRPEALEHGQTPLQQLLPDPWRPLASGDGDLDRLWRLGQPLEAWETWRQRQRNRPPRAPQELLVEGRLRQGVGDDWTGLGQLERAHLALPAGSCQARRNLERDLHPLRFGPVFLAAGQREGVDPALLLAVALQESRFTPAVQSAAGAVGLMQLMPGTAAELAGGPVDPQALKDPATNVPLGARYLRQLLLRWQGNPLLAVASYNAGPGAVEGWISPQLRLHPELWVEAIPYPETRLYVKKVLGNHWSYRRRDLGPPC